MMVAWEDYVEVNPEVLVGKPVIKGTRLSIEFIMERLANGWTEEEIIENYPYLYLLELSISGGKNSGLRNQENTYCNYSRKKRLNLKGT